MIDGVEKQKSSTIEVFSNIRKFQTCQIRKPRIDSISGFCGVIFLRIPPRREKKHCLHEKITKSSPIFNSFGGINFVIEALDWQDILQLMENQLCARNPHADYS